MSSIVFRKALVTVSVLCLIVSGVHRAEAQVAQLPPNPIPNPNVVIAELIRIVVRDHIAPSVGEFLKGHAGKAIPQLKARMRELRDTTDPRGRINFLWTNKATAAEQKQIEVFAATQSHLLPREYTASVESIEKRKADLAKVAKDPLPQNVRDQQAKALVDDIERLQGFLQDKLGIVIEQPDLQNLLSRADGPDSLRSLVSIVLLSHVVGELTKEVREENYETSAFLHRVLIDALGRHQAKYDTDWLKQLGVIEAELKAKAKKDEEFIRSSTYRNATADLKKLQQSILAADKSQLASIGEYRRVLIAQKANVQTVLKEAAAATQIYKSGQESIRISSKLSAMLAASKAHYATLRSIQRPMIVRFKDREHRQRHEDISLRMAQIKG